MEFNLFLLDSERETNLWKNGVFVFDTSSIGALYGLVPSSQEVMKDILDKFSSRTWIPAQVIYEYMKNREKMIMNPSKEYYNYPKDVYNSNLIERFDAYLKDFENEDFHPIMSSGALKELIAHRDDLKNTLNKVKEIIKAEHTRQRERITKIKEEDRILEAITGLPQGKGFLNPEVLEIIKEGELRYRNSIPPGYMDAKEKKGTQIYGDLIIWKELLQYAKDENKNIIFICDDVKEDWYLVDDKNKAFTPRHELLKEFHDLTGKECWLYPLKVFIEKLEEYHKEAEVLPLFKGLDAVKASLENKERRNKLKILSPDNILLSCDECEHMFEVDLGDLDWDWDCVEVDERSMGPESKYSTEEDIECPHCGSNLHLTFNVWEYPMGAYNYSNLEIEGGDIESQADFSDYMPHLGDEDEVCFKCGRHGSVGVEGLCSECQEEQERILTSDD